MVKPPGLNNDSDKASVLDSAAAGDPNDGDRGGGLGKGYTSSVLFVRLFGAK